VGRVQELGEVKKLLVQHPLLTLLGTGGVGKTRLAVQFAKTEARHYPKGAWFVELAPLTDERFIVEALAQTLNIKDTGGQPIEDVLVNLLQNRQLLLILDNCEHLLNECARISKLLLSRCPELKIVVTSREALGIEGEVTFRVPSLSLPDVAQAGETEKIRDYEAVRLFVEQAQAAETGFALSEKNTKAVTQICSQLDGIPLALELAAARLRSMSLEQLVSRLTDRFRLLTNGSRIALPRQQTLRALIDWSYNLLDERERVVLRRLAVFAGKWTLEAAEEICTGKYQEQGQTAKIRREEGLELILQLVNKSLVQLDKEEGRYYLLETIRQYAREKLTESGETEQYFRRYRDWYVSFALEAEQHLNGHKQLDWKKRILQEHDEIRAVLDWSLGRGAVLEAAQIVLALRTFWHSIANIESMSWLNQVYELSQKIELPPEIEANLYNALGNNRHSMGNFAEAQIFHLKALQLWQALGDKVNVANTLKEYGWHFLFQMKVGEAEHYANESLQMALESGDKRAIVAAKHLRAMAFMFSNRPKEAHPLVEESLSSWRELDDLESISACLMMLARLELDLGNYQRVKPLLAEALPYQLDSQNLIGIGISFNSLAGLMAKAKTLESAKMGARIIGVGNMWYGELMFKGAKKPGMATAIEERIKKEL